MNIKVLDCTLRDGGYVNNFAFGEKVSKHIIDGLLKTGVECLEIGFLRNSKTESETTVFTSLKEADALLPNIAENVKIFAMIVFGKFDIDKIPPKAQTKIDGIRVTFKKHEIDDALTYIKKIQEKGYIVSANPTVVNSYSDAEFLRLIEKMNTYKPDIFAVVDTLGVLKRNDMRRLFYLVNHNLNPEITLAFHSHNNLQLSFSNAQALLETKCERVIIIDSSLRGMGRGAGNLCTELLLQYLNDNYGRHYNLIPVLKLIDEDINRIYATNPWGYNVPYYLAAALECHPNYALFLIDKAALCLESIEAILQSIPENKKSNYDEKLVQELYLKFQENEVDDTEVLAELQKRINNRPILILAPGKTIVSENEKIRKYIELHHPFIISINFRPKDTRVDNIFISNERRYGEQNDFSDVIVTSNIKSENAAKLNYGSYLNNSEMADNSALMLLKVLVKLGVKKATFAGLDGFASGNDNYFSAEMVNNAKLGWETDKRNNIMREMLQRLKKQIDIDIITTNLYGL